MKTKAKLKKKEADGCTVQSHPNGIHQATIKHGIEYDFMYDDDHNFYLIIGDVLFLETSTAFKFVKSEN